jgi:hypothetical protein
MSTLRWVDSADVGVWIVISGFEPKSPLEVMALELEPDAAGVQSEVVGAPVAHAERDTTNPAETRRGIAARTKAPFTWGLKAECLPILPHGGWTTRVEPL